MKSSRRCVVFALLVATASCCASCAGYTPVVDVSSQSRELTEGDIVRVTTLDGEQTEFRIERITEDALVGRDEEIALSDVDHVERVHPRTWILIPIALAGFYFAVEATGGHWGGWGGSWQ